jgi:hypothetical protein
VDVLDDPLDHALELLARHVRAERRAVVGSARPKRGTGPASSPRAFSIVAIASA